MTAPGGIGGPGDNRPRSRLFRAAPEALFVDEEVPSIRMPAPPPTPLEEEEASDFDEDGLLSALAADDTEEEPVREGPARIYVGTGQRIAAPPPEEVAEEEEEDVLVLDEDLEESLGGPAVEVPGAVPGAHPDLRIRERKPMVVPPPRAMAGEGGWGDATTETSDEGAELWAGLAPPATPEAGTPEDASWTGEGEEAPVSRSRGFIKPPIRREPAGRAFTSRLFVRTILLGAVILLLGLIGWWLYARHAADRTEPGLGPTWSVDLTGAAPGAPEGATPESEALPTPTEASPTPTEALEGEAAEPKASPAAEEPPPAPRERTSTSRSTRSRTTTGSESSESPPLWDTPPPEPAPTTSASVEIGPITPIPAPPPTGPITLPVEPKGRITVKSDQAAVIFLSGERLGLTPIVDMEVPVGTYTIRATSRDSGLSQSQMVEVKPGETRSASFVFQE
ncbi:MAG: hypothetical protein JXB39_17060 [Deltaproteobacteria bacterium]|nr:hypothetical protein [Deltaproteobacteria bacterium]